MITKGQKIADRYEILKSLGEGGMANVYLARDTYLEREVAIKILRGDLSEDDKFVRRFQRESKSASRLTHPNIVEMYDVGEDNGVYYIVMEYVDGKTLKQLLKQRGHLTIPEAIDIMVQLTDGIAVAHDSYIIHRDIKPQNIMIKSDGRIVVTDFGVSMALNSTQLTQTNSVMGTVYYLPPEQASGKGSTIKSDIYSMGILFYELLTGVLPFKGENAVEIALKHLKDEIPSIRLQNPKIPQSIENIIIKATAKNPKNRYNDVREMHQDLLDCLKEENINQAKYQYQYPEHEENENNVLPVIKDMTIKDDTDEMDDLDEERENKRSNTIIWALSGIFGLIVVVLASIFFIIPALTSVPDVKVPTVQGLSVVDAERKLKESGFEVAINIEKVESSTIDKGLVVKTSPSEGRSIKKGTAITIYESIGKEVYEIEDYIGRNYIEVKAILETSYKLVVKIEKKDYDKDKEYGEQEIIGQSLVKGTKVSAEDEIVLYIPNIINSYPDMVADGWTLDEVKIFCDKYALILTYEEKESSQFIAGRVMSQSRAYKDPIIEGATLKVTIAIEPKEVSVPGGDPNLEDLTPRT